VICKKREEKRGRGSAIPRRRSRALLEEGLAIEATIDDVCHSRFRHTANERERRSRSSPGSRSSSETHAIKAVVADALRRADESIIRGRFGSLGLNRPCEIEPGREEVSVGCNAIGEIPRARGISRRRRRPPLRKQAALAFRWREERERNLFQVRLFARSLAARRNRERKVYTYTYTHTRTHAGHSVHSVHSVWSALSP